MTLGGYIIPSVPSPVPGSEVGLGEREGPSLSLGEFSLVRTPAPMPQGWGPLHNLHALTLPLMILTESSLCARVDISSPG